MPTLINSRQVSELLGLKDPSYALNRRKRDPQFPAAQISGNSVGRSGRPLLLWDQDEVVAYFAAAHAQGKKMGVRHSDNVGLDNEMARQFLTAHTTQPKPRQTNDRALQRKLAK
jgi:hypothetical protein